MSRDETSGLRAALLRLGRLPGYVRQPDLARRTGEQGHTYKKGWEVRFTARTEEEITEIRDLVTAAGFAPARPFFKGHQLIQPVYGMAVVQAYLAARQSVEESARATRGRRGAGAPAGAFATSAVRTAGPCDGPARREIHSTDVVTRDVVTRDVVTRDGTPRDGAPGRDRRTAAAAVAAASAAAAAAGSAAAAALAEQARRRAVESFPTQVERTTAPDRLGRAMAGGATDRVSATELRRPS
ncbi:hypothetical protein [Kitasatospora sp. NBC_00315]|uniref:hypothetical protein n=1 Tax=Kitasatospora sp. NBC_00315 TaxID=2975963 RepID=UPI0032483DDC